MTENTAPSAAVTTALTADEWQTDSDLEEEVARLAGLSPAAYEVERKAAAKSLYVRTVFLDNEVEGARKQNGTADDDGKQGQKLNLPETEPWPEAVDGGALVSQLQHSITSYVVLNPNEALTAALWVLNAHASDWFFISPRLHICSPEKQCGKTTLLRVLEPMVPRCLPTENITVAAVFRTIEAYRPVLFIDEADTFINDSDDLRGILNAGHQKDGNVIRTVGDDYEPRSFSVSCPVVIAGIGRIPATLEDRSIQIRLSRRKSGEAVDRLRLDRRGHLAELGRMAARWIADHEQAIRAGDPGLPEELSDRGRDNWRPLVTIADIISSECGKRARAAAITISGMAGDDETSAKVMALSDVWDVFEDMNAERLHSTDIVRALVAKEDRPWSEWKRGQPITQASLSRLLKPYDIKSKQMRIGEINAKGYEKAMLADAYERYVKAPYAATPLDPPLQSETPKHSNDINELTSYQSETFNDHVSLSNPPNSLENNTCFGVSDGNPGKGQGAHVSGEIDGAGDPVADDWGSEL